MIRSSRRLAVWPAIGCIALLTSFAVMRLVSFNSEQSDYRSVVASLVPQGPATHLYSRNVDVAEGDGGNALSYHQRDGNWVFEETKSVALDHRNDMPVPHSLADFWQYIWFQDGSLKILSQKADGSAKISAQSYFPLEIGQDELGGRHPELFEKYGDDGKTVVESTLQWYSGKARQHMYVDLDGRKHVIVYAEDGATELSERVFNKPLDIRTPPTLKIEKRWLDNPLHTQFYSDEQNSDGTRFIVDRDENGGKLWQATWANGDIVPGTIVEGYFPGTTKVRFHSESQLETDNVDYFRENGTLSARVAINHLSLSIDYYDKTGTKLRLSQNFGREDGPDFNLDKSSYSLSGVTEYDEDGRKAREFSLYEGHISMMEKVGDTVNGVAYAKVVYFFGPQGLSLVSYWNDPKTINDAPNLVDRDPKFKKVAPPVPIDECKLQVVFGDDMLPIPPVHVREPGG